MSEGTDYANPKPPSIDRLSLLWRRVNDRKIVQWSVAYVALAYGIQHGVVLTREAFEWPQAVERVSMLLLALGLPVVMTFAWYHGERASRRISGPELTIISILLMIGSLLFYTFVRPAESGGTASVARPSTEHAGVAGPEAATKEPAPTTATDTAIAVLPFENLSSEKEQEIFADGMTQEITSALAKVAELRVVGRTSAFQFKGQNRDLRAIGQALSATHLLEGSVRTAGNRVRITAELVTADKGVTVWTDSYDRDLTDVFVIQEDIAQAIVTALKVGMNQGKLLVSNRTIDPEAYLDYLRAKTDVRTREPQQASTAVSLLEKITARNSDYAPAWALLALAYDVAPQDTAWYSGEMSGMRRLGNDSLPKAETAALRAVKLDPGLADGYAALGRLQVARGKLVQAEESYAKALALDPNNPDTLQYYGNLLAEVGREKDSLTKMERLRAIEPLVPILNLNAAVVFWLNGQNEKATTIMEALPAVPARKIDLSEIYASEGRFRDAATELQGIPKGTFRPGILEEATRLLRLAPTTAVSIETLQPLGRLGFAYLYAGAPMRALEFHEASVDAGFAIAITTAVLWHPSYAPVRRSERFKTFIRKAGFVDYWRAKGWPDLCHPIPTDDFACD